MQKEVLEAAVATLVLGSIEIFGGQYCQINRSVPQQTGEQKHQALEPCKVDI